MNFGMTKAAITEVALKIWWRILHRLPVAFIGLAITIGYYVPYALMVHPIIGKAYLLMHLLDRVGGLATGLIILLVVGGYFAHFFKLRDLVIALGIITMFIAVKALLSSVEMFADKTIKFNIFKAFDSLSFQVDSYVVIALFAFFVSYFIFRKFGDFKIKEISLNRLINNAKTMLRPRYFIEILLTIMLVNSDFMVNSLSNSGIFSEDLSNTHFVFLFGWNVIFAFAIVYIFSMIFYAGLKTVFANKTNPAATLTLSALLAVLFAFLIQHSIVDTATNFSFFTSANLFNFIVLTFIGLIIFAIINRTIPSMLVITLLWTALVIGNALKFKLRGEPIFVDDLLQIANIGQILSFIQGSLVIEVGIAAVVVIALGYFLHRHLLRGKIYKQLYSRAMVVVVMVFSLFQLYGMTLNANNAALFPIIQSYVKWGDAWAMWQGNIKMAQMMGLSFNWMYSLSDKFVAKPADYSKSTVQNMMKKYTEEAKKINTARTSNNDQVVIYILSESFSDPTAIPGVTTSEDPFPFIRSLTDQYGGKMISSGYGGGTANMEFEAMTSMSNDDFLPNANIKYTQVLPKMSYVPSINQLFPQSMAIHGNSALMYDRKRVFQQMGINHFYALSGAEKMKHTAGIENNGYVSDVSSYTEVLDRLHQFKKGGMINLLTMQNHMPYEHDKYTNTISVKADGMSEDARADLETYTNGLKLTDEATENFIDKLSNMDKKVTVVFYGDHLPGMYDGKVLNDLNSKDDNLKQETPYFIWSNYDTQAAHKPVVGPYDFTPMMLQQTNQKVSPYYALLTDIANELPAMELNKVWLADGSIDPKYKFTDRQKQLLADYKLVHYDLVNGEDYLLANNKAFFKVKK